MKLPESATELTLAVTVSRSSASITLMDPVVLIAPSVSTTVAVSLPPMATGVSLLPVTTTFTICSSLRAGVPLSVERMV